MKKKFKLDSPGMQTFLASVVAIIAGLVVGFIVLLCINPAGAPKAILTILKNYLNFTRPNLILKNIGGTLVRTAPLIMTSLAVTFAYKVGMFNIGVAGQYTIGIGCCMWAALAWDWPWYLCLLFAVVGGMVWGAIAGFLKSVFNVNEVISGIMLNWISLYIVNIWLNNDLTKETVSPGTLQLHNYAKQGMIPTLGLDKVLNNEYFGPSIFVAIIVAIIINIVLNKTVFGYELKATGGNKHAAKYSGMNDYRNIILTLAISGALAGLGAGLYYLTGIEQWETSASSLPAMGFDGIVAAFLGGLNPIGVIFSSYFIKHISIGGTMIDLNVYSSDISGLIVAIIIYFSAFTMIVRMVLKRLKERRAERGEKQ